MKELMRQAIHLLLKSKHAVALTGAGISAESGIPPFRGPGGLWERYDPEQYATIDVFLANPRKAWILLKELGDQVAQSHPNEGHKALAEMEDLGQLACIITQNIDGLHQKAGSRRVIEFHGSYKKMVCTSCQKSVESEKISLHLLPPRCECKGILKPDVILFGEPIPFKTIQEAFQEASFCDVLLVIGTSAIVQPASRIPLMAKEHGAIIIEINTKRTILTDSISDIFLEGSSSSILPHMTQILKEISKERN